MECIVRLAIAKHFKATHAAEGQPSVAAAVARLFEEDIEPNLSPTAKVRQGKGMVQARVSAAEVFEEVDANAFRQDRLYSEDMEVCIRSHWTLLETAFKARQKLKACIRSHWTLLAMAFGACMDKYRWLLVYSAGGDVLSIESWLALLAAGALLGRANHTGDNEM
eukprot:1161082-Pelagomonas_calceolata.AAC.4